jgi:hypothetical protein
MQLLEVFTDAAGGVHEGFRRAALKSPLYVDAVVQIAFDFLDL